MEIETILATDIRSTRNRKYLSVIVHLGMYTKHISLIDLVSVEYRNGLFIVRYLKD